MLIMKHNMQIIEGLITMVFGIIAWFFLPAFPDQNTFLSAEDTAIILRRVEQDRGDSVPDALTMSVLIKHLQDWKLWAIGTAPRKGFLEAECHNVTD
jgi:hypothetical protein